MQKKETGTEEKRRHFHITFILRIDFRRIISRGVLMCMREIPSFAVGNFEIEKFVIIKLQQRLRKGSKKTLKFKFSDYNCRRAHEQHPSIHSWHFLDKAKAISCNVNRL